MIETTTNPLKNQWLSRKTFKKVKRITEELHQGGYIDEMTVKWLSADSKPSKSTRFLHSHKDAQTNPGWTTTDNIRK